MSAPGEASTSVSERDQGVPAGLPQLRIRTAVSDQDIAAAAGIVGAAFASLHASEWLLADRDVRDRVPILSEIFAITVADAVQNGTVQLAADASTGADLGAAVWFDRTRPSPGPPDYDRRLAAAAGSAHDRFAHLDLLFDQHHPHEPHHFLAFLAVLPEYQSRGIGSELMRGQHAALDEKGYPAYLEASNADSARMYKRLGFGHHAPDFSLPNGATFTPMWREPASGGPG
jgi:GNAT superfamily N-acetyltransferase